MFSYWEQQSFLQYPVLVIGGGITGLSTAISLKELHPQLEVVLLERGLIPAGASTRNAGFACLGSFTELVDDLQQMPEKKVLQLISMRQQGLQLLRRRLGDALMDYRENGSYELIGETELPLLDRLDQVNQLLHPVLQKKAFSLCNQKIKTFGFPTGEVKALIENHGEGELDSGKMMRQLMKKAVAHGVEIRTGCNVLSITEAENHVAVTVQGSGEAQFEFHARKIAVCTNAFTQSLFADVSLRPGRGQVLLTAPLEGLPFKGIFHFNQGYYYFREINGRILFGGGRNLDFEGETTTGPALNDHIQQDLEEKLHRIILPGRKDVRVAQRWAGIMAFGNEKFPIITQRSSRIFLGVRMGGMGIAIGSEVGAQLAQMMLNKTE